MLREGTRARRSYSAYASNTMPPKKQQRHLAKQRDKIAQANKDRAQKTKVANEVVRTKRKASSELSEAAHDPQLGPSAFLRTSITCS